MLRQGRDWRWLVVAVVSQADLDLIRQRAEKAKRTPDLEWAYDLVHGLANDVLTVLDSHARLARQLQEQEQARSRSETFEDAIRAMPRESTVGHALDLVDWLRAAGAALDRAGSEEA